MENMTTVSNENVSEFQYYEAKMFDSSNMGFELSDTYLKSFDLMQHFYQESVIFVLKSVDSFASE